LSFEPPSISNEFDDSTNGFFPQKGVVLCEGLSTKGSERELVARDRAVMLEDDHGTERETRASEGHMTKLYESHERALDIYSILLPVWAETKRGTGDNGADEKATTNPSSASFFIRPPALSFYSVRSTLFSSSPFRGITQCFDSVL
jgi:hypothetical protein